MVDDKHADNNFTTVKSASWLENDRRYEALFEIRRDGMKPTPMLAAVLLTGKTQP